MAAKPFGAQASRPLALDRFRCKDPSPGLGSFRVRGGGDLLDEIFNAAAVSF